MNQEEIKRIFAEAGAIITDDHFVYAEKADGWYHGADYVNKDAVYPKTGSIRVLCRAIAEHFNRNNIDVVVGPTVGGVILSQWTAHWLTLFDPPPQFNEVLAVYADEEGALRILKRGYDKIVKGHRCLVVEDAINTGTTVKKTIEAVRVAGGKVIGVGALANRSGGKVTAATLEVPELFSLVDLDTKMYKEEECPICKEKGPKSVRTDLGKGKEFLTRMGL